MKKIIGNLFVAVVLALCLAGCNDPTEYDFSLGISGIEMPEFTEDIQGTDVTIKGKGFRQGDVLLLSPLVKPLDGTGEIEVEIKEITSEHLTFHFPMEARESGYSLVLVRGVDFRLSLGTMQSFMLKGWIKDPALRNAIRALNPDVFDAQDSLKIEKAATDVVGDANGALELSGKGITSLQGIGYFPKVRTIRCTDNNLGVVDLTGCTALEAFFAWSSQITGWVLDNPNMVSIYGGTNPYTRLDLSKCPRMYNIVCGSAPLEFLDISTQKAFDWGNFAFTFSTDKTKERILRVNHGLFIAADLRNKATALREAGLDGVTVMTIADDGSVVIPKVSFTDPVNADMPDENLRAALKAINPAAFNSSNKIVVAQAKATNFDANTLNISNKSITSLAGLEYFTGAKNVICSGNNLGELDLTDFTTLVEFTAVGAGITNLTLGTQGAMKKLNVSNNQFTSLDITYCMGLTSLLAENCPLEYVDVRNLFEWSYLDPYTTTNVNFSFTTSTANPRVLKVETWWIEGWKGTGPVQAAIDQGIRVECYDWVNANTGHDGHLEKVVNE